MSGQPYEKVVNYHFEVEGEIIAITEIGADYVHVSEVRKNGQEDTHMASVLILGKNGKYAWEDEDNENPFVIYHSKALAIKIRQYVNTHGLPATD